MTSLSCAEGVSQQYATRCSNDIGVQGLTEVNLGTEIRAVDTQLNWPTLSLQCLHKFNDDTTTVTDS